MTIELKDKLYTSTEVANILGVSLRSVYRYLDEGKLDADVKTATGRHRFSKQNILNFLYPQGDTISNTMSSQVKRSTNVQENVTPVVNTTVKQQNVVQQDDVLTDVDDDDLFVNVDEEIFDTPVNNTSFNAPEELKISEEKTKNVEEDEEPVDWLAKFRAAAEKYREEQSVKVANENTNVEKDINFSESSDTSFEAPTEHNVTKNVVNEDNLLNDEIEDLEDETDFYYLSGVGGLKEIAQSLDKVAKKASLDYAFTLDAGLSLFKPIRPFSLIHAYIKPDDKDYFEKALKLTEVSKSSAQLCLLLSKEDDVFKNKREMYGLSVVSRDRLKLDLVAAGEKDLVSELDTLS